MLSLIEVECPHCGARGQIMIPPVGSIITEIDTGHRYAWTPAGQWLRQEQTIEAMFSELMDVNREMLEVLRATHRGNEEHVWEETVEIEEDL